jgi:signal transduction histidine kinase
MDPSPSLAAFESNGRKGLIGMNDRIEALGGTLNVSAPDRGGLQVQVRLPAKGRHE